MSSAYITRPYSFVSFILNFLINDVMAWKLKGENALRKSGLNYKIIRPGHLLEGEPLNGVVIGQKDRVKG